MTYDQRKVHMESTCPRPNVYEPGKFSKAARVDIDSFLLIMRNKFDAFDQLSRVVNKLEDELTRQVQESRRALRIANTSIQSLKEKLKNCEENSESLQKYKTALDKCNQVKDELTNAIQVASDRLSERKSNTTTTTKRMKISKRTPSPTTRTQRTRRTPRTTGPIPAIVIESAIPANVVRDRDTAMDVDEETTPADNDDDEKVQSNLAKRVQNEDKWHANDVTEDEYGASKIVNAACNGRTCNVKRIFDQYLFEYIKEHKTYPENEYMTTRLNLAKQKLSVYANLITRVSKYENVVNTLTEVVTFILNTNDAVDGFHNAVSYMEAVYTYDNTKDIKTGSQFSSAQLGEKLDALASNNNIEYSKLVTKLQNKLNKVNRRDQRYAFINAMYAMIRVPKLDKNALDAVNYELDSFDSAVAGDASGSETDDNHILDNDEDE
jgi:hypothetical protein